MLAIVATLFAVPSSQASAPEGRFVPSDAFGAARFDSAGSAAAAGAVSSGATVSPSPGRVTATVVPELLHVSRTDPTVGAGTLRKTTSASESEVVSADVRGVRCKSARRGLEFYRGRQRDWLTLRSRTHNSRAVMSLGRQPRNCADARHLAQVAKRRSFAARQATERWLERRTWDVNVAINYVFGPYAGQAHRVVSCESGHSTTASNGQYLGLFQMGSSERRLFGHGDSPLEQARAAHRYFVASGRDWSPWSCKP